MMAFLTIFDARFHMGISMVLHVSIAPDPFTLMKIVNFPDLANIPLRVGFLMSHAAWDFGVPDTQAESAHV